ncbi:UTRA domain protein [Brucella thiophenivorans]|uniref:UTRA domain protein n=2 Tax=Brucella thiophenivorans TaxID=571255 RepID=A0A256G7B3_9HYPH|nr:UTRA domain protein [Brucella thiophenivorans]
MFQFFKLTLDDGRADFPLSQTFAATEVLPSPETADLLVLELDQPVYRIERVRSLSGRPVINEVIWLPKTRFPDFETIAEIPNNIYQLISSRWGVTIARAEEQLRATMSDTTDAERLGCAVNHPLLAIQRVAIDLEGRPVELRQSRCLTDAAHYAVSLR